MAYRGQGQKVQKRSRTQVWLYEQVNMQIEGCIIGFDEYVNLALDNAEEIHSKTKSRKQLGVSCVCATRVTHGLKPARVSLLGSNSERYQPCDGPCC